MTLDIVVTDGISAHSWVVGKASNVQTALRWADAHRKEMKAKGCRMFDVGVWDSGRDRWVYEDDVDGGEGRGSREWVA